MKEKYTLLSHQHCGRTLGVRGVEISTGPSPLSSKQVCHRDPSSSRTYWYAWARMLTLRNLQQHSNRYE